MVGIEAELRKANRPSAIVCRANAALTARAFKQSHSVKVTSLHCLAVWPAHVPVMQKS
ncbi:hypothetical protein RHIZ404_200291 [Rhizobium sp. EC-SD404]|nr:hypothetical protein RHIZ404_200291 [Rhizobium sp. EC-SD404]